MYNNNNDSDDHDDEVQLWDEDISRRVIVQMRDYE